MNYHGREVMKQQERFQLCKEFKLEFDSSCKKWRHWTMWKL